jgi:hypothetical protein
VTPSVVDTPSASAGPADSAVTTIDTAQAQNPLSARARRDGQATMRR